LGCRIEFRVLKEPYLFSVLFVYFSTVTLAQAVLRRAGTTM